MAGASAFFNIVPASTITAYGMCQLGAFVYSSNPQKSSNPRVRKVAEAEGFSGTVVQDWGFRASDRLITQEWDMMPASFYLALDAVFDAGGTPILIDEAGNAWQVIVKSLDYDSLIAGGLLYSNVKMILRVLEAM